MNNPAKISGPAYRIETSRLVVRCADPADVQRFIDAVGPNIEHLQPWLPWAGRDPNDFQSVLERLRRFRGRFDTGQDFLYLIFSPDETRLLGGTGLHPRLGEKALEIGYWIHKDYINQGLVTEASAALTRVAFEVMHVNRVEIHCDPKNVRSAAVPRKLGYTLEATLRQRLLQDDGTWRDTMIWTLLAQDYPASPCLLRYAADIRAFDAIGRRII